MKHLTAELTGAALDYAVALAEDDERERDVTGCPIWYDGDDDPRPYAPSELWEHGGRLVEQCYSLQHVRGEWRATVAGGPQCEGATALQAVCRAYVAARIGQTVDIPGDEPRPHAVDCARRLHGMAECTCEVCN